MKKILTKALSLVICIGFTGLQMSLAQVLTTGKFAGEQILGGRGAVISGHTAGLYDRTTDLTNATLKFNAHTRIDWSRLNVDRGQTLYFNNGTYGVLNNVVGTSISKFAGIIKSDNGKIIISNPNGMIFNGGKFDGGSLLLTTKDLTGNNYQEGFNYNNLSVLDATNAGNTNYAVVAVIGGSEITSPDINIVANGVYFDNATLSSPNANGVVLVTADGANFEVGKLVNMDGDLSYRLESASVDQNNLYVANTTIKGNPASNAVADEYGTITFTSNKGVGIVDTTVTNSNLSASAAGNDETVSVSGLKTKGDVKLSADTVAVQTTANTTRNDIKGNLTIEDNIYNVAQAPGARLSSTDVSGKLNVTSKDSQSGIGNVVRITDVKAGETNVDAGTVYLTDVNLGKTNAKSSVAMVNVSGTSKFDTLDIDAATRVVLGSSTAASKITANSVNAKAADTVCTSADIVADDVVFDGGLGGVVQYNSTVKADSITVKSDNGEVVGIGFNDFKTAVKNGYRSGAQSSDFNVAAKSGTLDLDVTTDKQAKIAANATTVNAKVAGGDIAIKDTQAGGLINLTGSAKSLKATAESTDSGVHLTDINVVGDVTASADVVLIDTDAQAKNTIGGKLTATDSIQNLDDAPGVRVSNTDITGTMDVSSNKNVVRITNVKAADSNVEGGTVYLTGVDLGKTNAKSTVSMVNVSGNSNFDTLDIDAATRVVLGSSSAASTITANSVNAKAADTVCTSADVIADNVVFDGGLGGVVQYNSTITADSIKVKSDNGEVVGIGFNDFKTAVRNGYRSGAQSGDFKVAAKNDTLALDVTTNEQAKIAADAATLNAKVKGGDISIKDTKAGGVANITGSAKNLTASSESVNGEVHLTDITTTGDVTANADIIRIDTDAQAKNTIGGKLVATDSIQNLDDAPGVYVEDTDITGTMDVSSNKNVVRIENTKAADSNVEGGTVYLKDVNLGKTDAKSTVAMVNVSGTSNFDTLDIDAATRVVLGSSTVASTITANKIDATAGNTVCTSANITADDITFTATEGSVVKYGGTIKADKITLEADNGEIVSLDRPDFVNAVANGYSGGATTYLFDVNSKTANADMDLNVGANLVKVHSTAKHTDVEAIPGVTTNQVEILADGSAKVHDFNVTKKADDTDDTTGNLIINTGKVATVENNNTDTNIIVLTEDDVVANNLKADNEGNGVGDIIINGKNTTLKNSSGANVTEIATGKAVADTVTSTNGKVQIASTTADVDADKVTSNKGDVIIKAETFAKADDITANLGNITIEAKGNIDANNVVANRDLTNDDNTIGNITVHSTNGGKVTLDTLTADTNVIVVTAGDVVANKLTGDANQENGVGDVIINGKNTTLTNSSAVNVTEVATAKAVADNVTSYGGDVAIQAATTATASNITANQGNVRIKGNDKVVASNVKAIKGDDDTTGNIKVQSVNGDVDLDTLTASTNVEGYAQNGSINVLGSLKADWDIANDTQQENTVGDVILSAKKLAGENFTDTQGSQVQIIGANVKLNQTDYTDTLKLQNVTAVAVGNDEAGDVLIKIPTSNVVLNNINATRDIVVDNGNYDLVTANLNKVHADSEWNGIGDLKLTTTKNINASDIAGANIELTSQNGNIKVDGAKAHKADQGDDKGNITLTANSENANIELGNVEAETHIIANANNGTINVVGDLNADYLNNTDANIFKNVENGVGDVRLNAKKLDGDNFTTTTSNVAIKGANVKMTQTGSQDDLILSNVTAIGLDDNNGDITYAVQGSKSVDMANINATHDINVHNDVNTANTAPKTVVTFDNTITLNDVHADSEMNGRGEINLRAKGLVKGDNVSGANIILESTENNVELTNATAARAADETTTAAQYSVNPDGANKSGNIVVTANNGTVKIGDLTAGSDIVGTSENGTINVIGALTADAENQIAELVDLNSNSIGDVILSGKTLTGDNFTPAGSATRIQGANVKLYQTETPADKTLAVNNIYAVSENDNAGDVIVAINGTDTVDISNIHATKDIDLHNNVETAKSNPKSVTTFNNTITLKDVYADAEEDARGNIVGNGVGDLNLKAKGLIDADGISGANITLRSTQDDVVVNDATTHRGSQPDNNAGTIKMVSDNGDVTLGNIDADTHIIATALEGNINQTGHLAADTDKNGIGEVSLTSKNGLDVGGDKGAITGADITLTVTEAGDIVASNLDADGQGSDTHGNITINTPKGDVKIGTDNYPVNGTGNVYIETKDGKANVVNTKADSEENGYGTLTIKATDDIVATNDGGANVIIETPKGDITATDITTSAPYDENNGDITITTGQGNVVVDDVHGDHDVTITAKKGDDPTKGNATVTNTDADKEQDGNGTLTINADNDVIATNDTGANIVIDAGGDVTGTNLDATGSDENGTVDNGNIDITAGGDVDLTDVDANHDIEITAGGKVDLDDVHADAENDGFGDLIIHAGDDVDITDGSGSNIGIVTDNGDVTIDDTHATGDDDLGNGNIVIVAPKGDVTITDSDATNNVIVNVTTGDVNYDPTDKIADSDDNTVGKFIIIRNGGNNNNPSNPVIPSDADKLLNELLQEGINTQSASGFTPIAFAADDDDESEVLKRIVKTVFKTPETGIVTITDRFKSMK